MARDRRRPTNRHVQRPRRAPIHRQDEPEPNPMLDVVGLAESIDENTVNAALAEDVREPSTWLALLMLLSAQTTTTLTLIQSLPTDDAEKAVSIVWAQAKDAPDVMRTLREAAVILLALTSALEEITEPADGGGV
jgi:hypothetical protein